MLGPAAAHRLCDPHALTSSPTDAIAAVKQSFLPDFIPHLPDGGPISVLGLAELT